MSLKTSPRQAQINKTNRDIAAKVGASNTITLQVEEKLKQIEAVNKIQPLLLLPKSGLLQKLLPFIFLVSGFFIAKRFFRG